MTAEFDSVEDAIAAIAAGELIVVVDDDDRENEGDLIMAAAKASSDKIGFMIRHTSGLLWRLHNRGAGQTAASRSDGGPQRSAAGYRLHGHRRLQGRPDNRHFRGRTRQHGSSTGEQQHGSRRLSPAPVTSCHWCLAREAYWYAPATPKRRSTCPTRPACHRLVYWPRSSMTTAIRRSSPNCANSPPNTTSGLSRSPTSSPTGSGANNW